MGVAHFVHSLFPHWQADEAANQNHEDSELRKNLSEKQIDEMVAGTFPASDPPSTY